MACGAFKISNDKHLQGFGTPHNGAGGRPKGGRRPRAAPEAPKPHRETCEECSRFPGRTGAPGTAGRAGEELRKSAERRAFYVGEKNQVMEKNPLEIIAIPEGKRLGELPEFVFHDGFPPPR